MTQNRSYERSLLDGDTGPAPSRDPTSIRPITVRIPDAAKMLGLSRSRIYELITSGDIEVIKLGRATLVPVAGLEALIERLKREQLWR